MKFRNAVITGGSSGIGKALAKLLVKEGLNVVILARNAQRLEEARREIEAARLNKEQIIETFPVDVSNYSAMESIMKTLTERGRPPELLINSAGVVYADYFEKIPTEEFKRVMEIDYFGTLNAIRAALPSMLSRGGGHIVNLSSAAGYVGVFGYGAYTPTKFAVTGLSEVLRQELKPYGILVSIVCPPDTKTPQLEEELKMRPQETSAINAGASVMEAEEVAKIILKGIHAKKYLILPGLMNKITYLLNKTPIVRWICDMTVASVQKKRRST